MADSYRPRVDHTTARVHRPSDRSRSTRPQSSRSDYSSLPQSEDANRNPVTLWKDDLKLTAMMNQHGEGRKLSRTYHPGAQSRGVTSYTDTASASLAGQPYRTDPATNHTSYGGARPKISGSSGGSGQHLSRSVIGQSGRANGDVTQTDSTGKKTREFDRAKTDLGHRPEKYATPNQGRAKTEYNNVRDPDKDPKIRVKVHGPGSSTRSTVDIVCDINMYMKWQFILRNPTRLVDVNTTLDKLCSITEDSEIEVYLSFHEQAGLIEKVQQIISAVVSEFGKDLKVERVYVSEEEAQPIVEKLLTNRIVHALRLLYAKATSDKCLHLVYDARKESAVKQQIENVYQRFSVRVKLPFLCHKLFERVRIIEKLQAKHPEIRISFFECKDDNSIVCDIFGYFFKVTEAAGKVIYYRDNVQTRTVFLSQYLMKAVGELNLSEVLQSKIDEQMNGGCLLVQAESGLLVLGFKREFIDAGIRLVEAELIERVFKYESDPGKQEKMEMLWKKLEGVVVIHETDHCVVAGLTEDVTAAVQMMKTGVDFYDERTGETYTKKSSFENEDLLDTMKLLAEEIAKLNHVAVDFEKISKKYSVRFKGNKEGVEKSVKDFNNSKTDVKTKELYIDQSWVQNENMTEVMEKLQTECKVKVLIDMQSGQTDMKQGQVVLNKVDTRCTWTFPTGRSLMVDVMDMSQCTDPDALLVVAKKKSSISGILSAIGDLGSKQNKLDMQLPKWSDKQRDAVTKVQSSMRKLLKKLTDQDHKSLGIILETLEDWPFLKLAQTLLTPVLRYLGDFSHGGGIQDMTFCCDSVDKCKKTEALIRSNIGDPDFNENEVQVEVISGELNLFEADVLVNTTSPTLDLNHGSVSAAMLKSAGPELQTECKQKYPEGVRGARIAVTGGYGLKCQYVFHGALSKYSHRNPMHNLQELRDFLEACLQEARRLSVMSIAFPVIGSGNLGYPSDLVASEMFSAVERLKLTTEEHSLRFVYFVVYHRDIQTLKVFERVQTDMIKFPAKPNDTSLVEGASKTKDSTKSVTVKIIGQGSSVEQAAQILKQRLEPSPVSAKSRSVKQGVAEGDMQQMVTNVTSHEYMVFLKIYPAKIEEITDAGVGLRFEDNMIKFGGKLDKITEAVIKVKDMLQELRSMYHIHISVKDMHKSQIKSTQRQILTRFPEVHVIYDEVMAIVNIYGQRPDQVDDVKEAGRMFGYNTDDRQARNTDSTHDRSAVNDPSAAHRGFTWTGNAGNLKVYQAGRLVVRVYEGDLLEAPVDCIVNAANKDLNHAGGVAHVIAKRAGEELKRQCYSITQQAPLIVGSVVETTAGKLPYKYVLHTVGPCWYEYQPITKSSLNQCEADLYTAILNTFKTAEELKMSSIALPAISSAIFKVPREICAFQYARAIMSFARDGTHVREICFVDKDGETIRIIQDAFQCMIAEDRPYNVNTKVYIDVQHRHGGFFTQDNGHQKGGMNRQKNGAVGGMVLLDPFYKMDGHKMVCVFTTSQEIHIFTENILELKGIDAIVCSEDKSFAAAGILAKELIKKGGDEYKKAKSGAYKSHSIPEEGDVIMSRGGRNKFSWVMHALIPNSKSIEYLKDLVEDILEKCVKEGLHSVVMPLLGSGQGKKRPELCAKQLLTAYEGFCVRNPGYKFTLYIVNIQRDFTNAVQSVFKEHIDNHSVALMPKKTQLAGNQKLSRSVKRREKESTLGTMNAASSGTNKELTSRQISAETGTKHKDGILRDKGDDPENKQTTFKGENSGQDKNITGELSATCVICMDKLDNPKTLKCGHAFCTDCIEQYFKVKPVCPTCFTVCGVITGDQPDGEMEIMKLRTSVTGYEDCGSIGVSYRFENGHQGPQHPSPGCWYHGISRTGYLPNTEEGRKICAMLRVAFERRLVFTIGTSRTTGQEGVITWNDIHHKTDHRPNTQFGYPDLTYLVRVKDELAVKGVMEEDIDTDFLAELKTDTFYRKNVSVTKV